jgi:hypothetical protein
MMLTMQPKIRGSGAAESSYHKLNYGMLAAKSQFLSLSMRRSLPS